jgi:predicted Fe-Mo cluster-binding NifX family protein
MKIVITAASPRLDARVDSRFGRCAYFVIVDMDSLDWQAYPNPAVNASGGAGTYAAQFIAERGIQAALSGDFGPNAYAALNAAHIAMFSLGSSQTVREAVEGFKAGHIAQVGSPTAVGHDHS